MNVSRRVGMYAVNVSTLCFYFTRGLHYYYQYLFRKNCESLTKGESPTLNGPACDTMQSVSRADTCSKIIRKEATNELARIL